MRIYSPVLCPECGEEMQDVNEGYFFLRYGPPEFECPNQDCIKNSKFDPKDEKTES